MTHIVVPSISARKVSPSIKGAQVLPAQLALHTIVYCIPSAITTFRTSMDRLVIWYVWAAVEVVWQLAMAVPVLPMVVPTSEQFVLLVPSVMSVDVCRLSRLKWFVALMKSDLGLSLAETKGVKPMAASITRTVDLRLFVRTNDFKIVNTPVRLPDRGWHSRSRSTIPRNPVFVLQYGNTQLLFV